MNLAIKMLASLDRFFFHILLIQFTLPCQIESTSNNTFLWPAYRRQARCANYIYALGFTQRYKQAAPLGLNARPSLT
jgi:hypothetical protein